MLHRWRADKIIIRMSYDVQRPDMNMSASVCSRLTLPNCDLLQSLYASPSYPNLKWLKSSKSHLKHRIQFVRISCHYRCVLNMQ